MRYGELPTVLTTYEVNCNEMMFYQYLPIKLAGSHNPIIEDRLKCFKELIGAICCDFIGFYGLDAYVANNVYLSAKYLFQGVGCSYNRMGWHCDGFMSNDINYIWSDSLPTVFNSSNFSITLDDSLSMKQMERQALPCFDISYPVNTLLRLNQFNVHRVADVDKEGMRTFLKISFSTDKYDLIGNSHNYLLNYDWEMKQRNMQRNIPQSKIN